MVGLTDAEVNAEMSKMTAFIKQEATEKAREIKVKADEEFTIEKGKIVRQESVNIEANSEKKKKQIVIQKKINESTATNASRLKLLELREELLESAFEDARKQLASTTKDEGKYTTLLRGLILQAMYTMQEKDLTISARAVDLNLVKKAATHAAGEFEKTAGYAVKVEVNGELPKGSAGGITVTGYNSRIVVNNTLDERLRLLEEKMLPEIRDTLFGQNVNRRFFS